MTSVNLLRSTLNALMSVGLLVLALSSPAALAQGLPELSDSASLIMNNEQEKMFGKQVMLSIRARSHFSNDVLLLDYFTRLASRLAQQSPRDFGELTVNVAIDPAINAFAVPGGYITVNTGLIDNTRTESELASVIAHEIGHQSQRHISRAIERSKQLTLPAAAAMIGGLLIGGSAGTAAVLTTQAAVGSDQLAYSRTFEREADATGMNILAAAGYDPAAMPAFFGLLEKQSSYSGGIVLEFLSTHPVSADRIADGRSRASRLQAGSPPEAPPADRLDYAHAEARTMALYADPIDATIKHFEYTLSNNQANEKIHHATAYGLVIAYARNDEFEKSVDLLQQLLTKKPHNALYILLEAELASISRKPVLAAELYGELYRADPTHPAVIQGYTLALLHSGDYPAAIRILRKTIRHQPNSGWAYGLLARAYETDGKTLNSMIVEAQNLRRVGMYSRALALLGQQLQKTHADSSDYLTASVSSLIKQIKEEKRQLDNFDL